VKANLQGPHDLGEIAGYAWQLYLRNFVTMFPLALIPVPVQMLIAAIQDRVASEETQATILALFFLPSILVSLVSSSALVAASNDAINETPADFGRAVDAAFSRFLAVLSTTVLGLALSVASLVGIVYFAVRWTFGVQAVMIEGKRNWAALDQSSSIVKGRWWRTFGILLFITMALMPAVLIDSSGAFAGLVPSTLISVLMAAVLPYAVAAQTLLYYDLKARNAVDNATARIDDPEPGVPRQGP
jgi:hypothetical protein